MFFHLKNVPQFHGLGFDYSQYLFLSFFKFVNGCSRWVQESNVISGLLMSRVEQMISLDIVFVPLMNS